MRCFKSFFKHTWHPQQMESSGKFNNSPSRACGNAQASVVNETELGELKIISISDSSPTQTGIPCYNGACKSSKGRLPQHRLDSPWHYLKTLFLVSMIVALIIWIIAYVLLAQYEIL